MPIIKKSGNTLTLRNDTELLTITPWAKNSLRVRAVRHIDVPDENWALLPQDEPSDALITVENGEGVITNGKISAKINSAGMLYFYGEDGKPILREFWRSRAGNFETKSALEMSGREFYGLRGGDFELTARFEPNADEHIYGMGQYQDGLIDKKGCVLELAHRNSQASVPFYVSSAGYGFLWNNPSIGRATFARNRTEWYASSTKSLDYWITASDSPAEIMSAYADATGHAPMMPDYVMGFWQCKLRYRTQDELLEVARKHKALGLPMDVIVSDFFHWPYQGDWRFDEDEWPDPDAMVRELKEMGIELMVSIWPYVDQKSENYAEMRENGYLVRAERGLQICATWKGNTIPYDPTNPEARDFVWGVIKRNYFDKGIKIFWLDEAEPEWDYDFDHYRYAKGANIAVGNIYPLVYAQNFYEGLKNEGVALPINLLRCAWAGSQRYGALVWSGDIDTTFRSFREQFTSGLSMAMSGIPWWTSDIGGFHGGDQNDPDFRELLVRWFQFGAFCPVFRLHGDRLNGDDQGLSNKAHTGGPNEVWSYGEEVYEILKKYLFLREELRPYIKSVMEKTAATGAPVIRPLYYDFPRDKRAATVEDEMMLGDDILVAPVFELGARTREVYLPEGAAWIDAHTGMEYTGGQAITAEAPLELVPVFVRKDGTIKIKF
jgi:alpha-D-xyloside xylohydrolase